MKPAKIVEVLLELHHRISFELSDVLKKAEISLSQYHLLNHMSGKTGINALSMTDVSRFCRNSTAAGTGTADRLEKLGYIERKYSSEDRRKVLVQLTKKGETLLKNCHATVSKLYELDDEFLESLHRLIPDLALAS
ncbi:MAG: MarR family transcriptional regulator [Patescibacteria group bacterium]